MKELIGTIIKIKGQPFIISEVRDGLVFLIDKQGFTTVMKDKVVKNAS